MLAEVLQRDACGKMLAFSEELCWQSLQREEFLVMSQGQVSGPVGVDLWRKTSVSLWLSDFL